jgi:hypothetical protein
MGEEKEVVSGGNGDMGVESELVQNEESMQNESHDNNLHSFSSPPQQSSPQKVVSVHKNSAVPHYLLHGARQLRSEKRDKIHIDLAYRTPNPFSFKSPFKRKK